MLISILWPLSILIRFKCDSMPGSFKIQNAHRYSKFVEIGYFYKVFKDHIFPLVA